MSARYTGGLVYNAPGGWSGYFDGTGDYLSIPDNAGFDFGSGNFTIETWANFTSASREHIVVSQWPGASNRAWVIAADASASSILFAFTTNGTTQINVSASSTFNANAWYHIAVCRDSTNLRIFVNGVLLTTYNISTSTIYNSSASVLIGAFESGSIPLLGYVSNCRIVKGTALYTAAFTPPSGPLQAITNTSLLTCAYPTFRDGSTNNLTVTAVGNTVVSTLNPFPTSQLPNPALGGAGNGVYTMSQYAALKAANLWPSFDPFYRNVTLNLHGDGTNGAQNNTFLDSSTNNFTLTRNGNTTQGTFTPYGNNWSVYFDGSGDYLTAGSSISLSSNFTVEGWVYRSSSSGNGTYLLGLGNDFFSTGATFFADPSTGYLRIYTGQAHLLAGTSGSVPLNTWSHVAFVRNSNTLRAYLNGVQVDSASWSATISGTAYIGAELNGNPTATVYPGSAGYLSNLRVNTTAVYTAAFTPSTAPLPAITGTQLLTCQSNRFVDNSTNAYTITRNGDTSVQRFSPFSPTTAYSTSVIGGSGYFDGTGDYLSTPANAAFAFGTGDFTIEFWAYKTANTSGNYDVPFGTGEDGTGNNGYFVELSSTRGFVFAVSNAIVLSYAMNPNTAAWNHYAVTRSGSTLRLFVGGAVVASTTYSTSLTSTLLVRVGGTANHYFGYLSDLRVIKGTAVYTTTYTLPTAPLTAITNTSLLTNFTNAGILDNAMMNDLETVGNAQISTSVKKYGTGSMYFDGTGDRLTAPASPNIAFGTGDFTVEFWLNSNNVSSANQLGVIQTSDTAGGLKPGFTTGISINQGTNASGGALSGGITAVVAGTFLGSSSAVITTGTWYHIALVRSSGTSTIYVNGTSVGSATTTGNCSGQNICVGGYYDTTYLYSGYIDDLRITKGVARYTTTFTPPTSQVQDQ
jgi:hypothetical protein